MVPDARADTVDDRLDSWKDIAAYLRRDVSTAQRWEKREGLPVHRHIHDKQGSVYAFKSELDAWWQQGRKRLENTETTRLAADEAPPPVWRRRAPIAGVVAFLVVVVGLFWTRSTIEPPVEIVRSEISLPPDALAAFALGFSPDGKHIVYVGLWSGPPYSSQLFVKATNELASRPLEGTLGARQPFFSPDGKWIGFFANGQLRKVALDGGSPITLAEAPQPRGGTWGPDNTIVFAPDPLAGLARVSAAGGTPTVVTTPDRKVLERTHRFPHFLPGGRAVLFTVHRADQRSFDDADIEAVELDSGIRTPIVRGGTRPVYTGSGHLVFGRNGTLLAAPFDATRLRIANSPVRVAEDVRHDSHIGGVAFAVSPSGALVYARQGTDPTRRHLLWVNRTGRAEPMHPDRGPFVAPRISPDGRSIAIVVDEAVPRIWLYDVARGTLSPRSDGWDAELPSWSPDSSRIAFNGFRLGPDGRLLRAPLTLTRDGSETATPLAANVGGDRGPWWVQDWSPDGSRFVAGTNDLANDLWLLNTSSHTAVPIVTEAGDQGAAKFSRNGKWIAYVSNESGRDEVYVREIASPHRRWPVSVDGGMAPVWSHDGRELFYIQGRRMMAVKFSAADGFKPTEHQILFVGSFYQPAISTQYDVAPDGRFVMLSDEIREAAPKAMVLVQNWFEELRQKAPLP